jgi:hypothetical protein
LTRKLRLRRVRLVGFEKKGVFDEKRQYWYFVRTGGFFQFGR